MVLMVLLPFLGSLAGCNDGLAGGDADWPATLAVDSPAYCVGVDAAGSEALVEASHASLGLAAVAALAAGDQVVAGVATAVVAGQYMVQGQDVVPL
jgi:hypothetical protein